MDLRTLLGRLAICAVLAAGGCQMAPPEPPVTPNFVFTPPSSVSATHSNMSIAIQKPAGGGTLFTTTTPMFESTKTNIENMVKATETDLEKIIIAKGFTTAGTYDSIEEMTYSQKQRAALILQPVFTIDLAISAPVPFQPSSATISGTVVLEFREPMSREKVWIKRVDLAPVTKPVRMDLGQVGGQMVPIPTTNAITDLLNSFYGPAMQKIWDQLDPREVQSLKRDSDKLKSTTQYRGGQ